MVLFATVPVVDLDTEADSFAAEESWLVARMLAAAVSAAFEEDSSLFVKWAIFESVMENLNLIASLAIFAALVADLPTASKSATSECEKADSAATQPVAASAMAMARLARVRTSPASCDPMAGLGIAVTRRTEAIFSTLIVYLTS